jgi:hypothetical protein
MIPGNPWSVPFIPDFSNLAIDSFISFTVSILLAIMINAEAQAWVAALLGDSRPGAKDRFHFNAFFHLDIMGTICFLVGGFGWPRPMDINPEKFQHPRLYIFLARLAGPIANILLANIAASLVFGIQYIGMEPLVFLMVMGVNVTTAVYNLAPLPPLALGAILTAWLPQRFEKLKWLLTQAGPFLIVAIVLLERIAHVGIISPYINPIVLIVFKFIRGG